MTGTESIAKIQHLFEGWRLMGCERLPNGIELLARAGTEGQPCWLHVVFPGLSEDELDTLEKGADVHFPDQLRAFYQLIGGMTLFHGAFRVFGRHRPGVRTNIGALQPHDLAELNHEIDALGWKPGGAVAFAVNSWDQSVHLAGMGSGAQQIVRCDRATGRILERHADVFECIFDRLYRLDQLMQQ